MFLVRIVRLLKQILYINKLNYFYGNKKCIINYLFSLLICKKILTILTSLIYVYNNTEYMSVRILSEFKKTILTKYA